jgi:MoxR-like ATPase
MDQISIPTDAQVAARLRALLAALGDGLVERERAVRLALLAALAGEHTLLIGPPGTAKSELARRIHLAFGGGHYFERLLTRFSVPEELFGPLSISALEDDRYERQTAGFLPTATVAFIDEVFKANSAILNALLTLLNEREFDNGAGRVRCPLISAIGATNEVPADEVGEAFFDRFLVRIPVEPVSAEGFAQLLAEGHRVVPRQPPAEAVIAPAVREAIAAAAARVSLAAEAAALIGELRAHLAANEHYVSDRRWVKIGSLLRTLAASEGRTEVVLWDLWLLPWCIGADAEAQSAIGAWLAARLGVREAFAPERVTRLVEAFEAQLGIEQEAEDIDYDAGGRLQFTNRVGEEIVDGKGAAVAQRMTYTRRRRYGACHIAARTGQIDELAGRLAGYLDELAARQRELATHVGQGLWIDPGFAAHATQSLADTGRVLASLVGRAQAARDGFAALPRLPEDPGVRPDPIVID